MDFLMASGSHALPDIIATVELFVPFIYLAK